MGKHQQELKKQVSAELGTPDATALCSPSQPFLFDEKDLPQRDEFIELSRKYEGNYKHTGKALSKDEELCFAICESLVMGLSARECARRFKVSRNTIGPMRERLREMGKLEPWKKSMSRKLGTLAEETVEAAIDDIRAGNVPANIKPIMAGVALDKKAALDGDPALRVEVTQRAEVSIEKLQEVFQQLRGPAPVKAIEVESSVSEGKGQ